MPPELTPSVALPKSVLRRLWNDGLYGLRNAAPLTVAGRAFGAGELKLVTIRAPLADGLYRGVLVFSTAPDNRDDPEPRGDLSFLAEYLEPPTSGE